MSAEGYILHDPLRFSFIMHATEGADKTMKGQFRPECAEVYCRTSTIILNLYHHYVQRRLTRLDSYLRVFNTATIHLLFSLLFPLTDRSLLRHGMSRTPTRRLIFHT